MADSIFGPCKTELIRNRATWPGLDDLELASIDWLDWFNHRRLSHELGRIPRQSSRTNTTNKSTQATRAKARTATPA